METIRARKRGLFNDFDTLELSMVNLLLAAGANFNVKSKEGKSPFSLAFESGCTELLDLFW